MNDSVSNYSTKSSLKQHSLSALVILVSISLHLLWIDQVQRWLNQSMPMSLFEAASAWYPTPLPWVYIATAWMPLCFGLSVGIVWLTFLFLNRLSNDVRLSFLLSILLLLLAVTVKIPKSDYYVGRRVFMAVAFIAVFAVAWFSRSKLSIAYQWLKQPKNANVVAYILIGLSIIQRLISLYVRPDILAEGDDPLYYHNSAVALAKQGILPGSYFSPGLPYYLGIFYKVFGVKILSAQISLIVLSTISLIILYRVVKRYYGGPLVGVITLLVFNLHSQYIASASQFLNDHFFMLLLPIFLWLIHRITELSKFGLSIIILSISLGFFLFVMSLFRSWAPILLVVLFIMPFFLRYKFSSFFGFQNLFLIILPFIIFVICSFGYKNLTKENQSTVATTSNLATIIIQGNNPYSQGAYSRHLQTYTRELGLENDINKVLPILWQYCIDHPFHLPTVFSKKAVLWFWGAGNPKYFGGYYLAPLSLAAYYLRIFWFLLSIAGFYLLAQDKKYVPTLLYFAMSVTFILLFLEHRFLLVSLPIQAIAIGYFVDKLLTTPSLRRHLWLPDSKH